MADNDIFEVIEENYPEIMLRIAAYAQKLIDAYTWFRGKESLPGGWSARDFALEALTRFLEHPEQFDFERSELTVNNIVAYLNRNLIRNLVRGTKNKAENKKSDDLHDENFEDSLPFAEVVIPEGIDVKTIKDFIEQVLSEEDDLLELFTGIFEFDLTRAEICEQLKISKEEYDRRMKRLSNRLNKASKVFTNDIS